MIQYHCSKLSFIRSIWTHARKTFKWSNLEDNSSRCSQCRKVYDRISYENLKNIHLIRKTDCFGRRTVWYACYDAQEMAFGFVYMLKILRLRFCVVLRVFLLFFQCFLFSSHLFRRKGVDSNSLVCWLNTQLALINKLSDQESRWCSDRNIINVELATIAIILMLANPAELHPSLLLHWQYSINMLNVPVRIKQNRSSPTMPGSPINAQLRK